MSYHAKIRRECGPETCPTIDRVKGRIGAALAIVGRIDALANPDLCEADSREAIREAVAEVVAALESEGAQLETIRDTAGSMRDTLADALRTIDEMENEREDLAGDVNALRERAEEAEARAETAEGDARRYAEEAADRDA